jgi:putative hydrolase of the HAD superfamily
LAEHYPKVAQHHTPESLRGLNQRACVERPELAADVTARRKAGLALAAREAGYDEAMAEAAFAIFYTARQQVTPFTDTLPALAQLRGAYTVGTLTNGNADVQRIGIGHLFHFTLSACDVGCGKPDPIIFREAARRAGVDPAAIVHVGDELDTDVAGARAIGMRTVWVNRTGQQASAEILPDAQIRSLGELPAILARWTA